MKPGRITSFTILVLALLLVLGQVFGGGAKAAPGQFKASVSSHLDASNGSNHVSASSIKPTKPQVGDTPTDQAPYHLTVEGQLSDPSGNPVPPGNYNMSFGLYYQPTGGSPYFFEGPVSVAVGQGGLFTYQLGTSTPFTVISMQFFASKFFLGIKVNNDQEMTPRFEMTAAPYAMSLPAGALVRGTLPESTQPFYGVFNAINDDTSDPLNAGIEGQGAIGVYAKSLRGYGLYGVSHGSLVGEAGAGVVGYNDEMSDLNMIAGGVFTATGLDGYGVFAYGGATGSLSVGHGVEGYVNTSSSIGIGGNSVGANGVGVSGSAYDYLNHVAGNSTAVGGKFNSYDNGSAHIGMQVFGQGHATGGFSTGLGFSMMVKYNGSQPLHPGDALGLDGNNASFNDTEIMGTVKTDDPSAVIGLVQYRYNVFTTPLQDPKMTEQTVQVDDKATTIQPGDYVQMVVLGTVKMKLGGSFTVGDQLTLSSDGSFATTKDRTIAIGRVASQPDKDDLSLVYVNFR